LPTLGDAHRFGVTARFLLPPATIIAERIIERAG
jgi:hypothetical protein